MKPVLLVVAGPNGAGKTTVTARLRAERWSEGVEYLNPDEIARDRFGDWNSPDAILKAAQWTSQRREELLAQGAGIAFETVLSTDEKIDFFNARARTHAGETLYVPEGAFDIIGTDIAPYDAFVIPAAHPEVAPLREAPLIPAAPREERLSALDRNLDALSC